MKPQIGADRLDALDASPHPEGMAKDPAPPKNTPPARETKLAQALRANLRRRKAGASQKTETEAGAKDRRGD